MGKGGELRVFFLMEESFGSFIACGVGEIGVRERWKGAWQQRVLSPDWSEWPLDGFDIEIPSCVENHLWSPRQSEQSVKT
jgi:hypothetical protein